MNKKNILTFLILIIFLLNIFALKAFSFNAFWDYFYHKNDYENALKYFNNAWNKQWIYNKANVLYKQRKYKESIKEYMSLLSIGSTIYDFRLNHNIANNFYRLWEAEKDIDKKIKTWEKSVEYYRNALNITYDDQAKKNLEFVLKKIEEAKNKKEKENNKEQKSNNDQEKDKNNQKNNKQDSDKKDKQNSKDTKQSGEKNQWETKEEWEKKGQESGEQKTSKEQKWESESNLSQDQTKALQQYEEALKQEQKNNSDGFNKVYRESNNSDPFDNFDTIMNDPFFNNDLLNWWKSEKDW